MGVEVGREGERGQRVGRFGERMRISAGVRAWDCSAGID